MDCQYLTKGKIAYVTGSTRGIGWAIAESLARQGATIILNGRSNPERLEERVSEIKERYKVDCIGVFGDVSKPDTVKTAFDLIFKTYKRLDILVNNAGVLKDALLGMIDSGTIEDVLSINTVAPLLNLQAAARLMGRNKAGSIINVASIVGVRGNEGQCLYSASKSAIVGMTLSAAKELAASGIRVNAIAPGLIDTDMVHALPQEKRSQLESAIKLGRVGTVEDVANVALFLASDMSSYVTGQVIGVDGGIVI